MSKLDEIAKQADTHDFSAEMTDHGRWETGTDAGPTVTTRSSERGGGVSEGR